MLFGYMRVSSDGDCQSTDLQRDALVAAGVDDRHLFEDRASGARDRRPGLDACLAFLKEGDTLVVWRLDRLGRSLPHLLDIIARLKGQGVAFRSLTEGMDTTTAHGELLFHLFGALAQYERALTRERIVAGLDAARRRGRHGGRPRAIEGEKLDAIIAALEGGASKASVCRIHGIARTTLLDTLRRAGFSNSSN
ncbi:recombinase family protein [Xanthobacter sediminis]|uniref:recombinase family protein n=1 Tax=Xanthobacter sediminis TaxID=3119926 RepID=UPI00372AF98C